MRFYRCIGRNTRQLLAGAGFLYAAATLPVGLTFAATSGGVTNIFKPLSTPAQAIHEVSLLVLAICAGIFLVVGGLLAYTLVRFRQRPGDDGHEPPQVYGSNQLEFAWTVIPIVTVFVLFLATARTIYDVQGAVPPADALNVTVVGHQWWWEIRYPELGIVTANELHVPVSESGKATADLPQARVGGCRAQLLGAATRRENRCDSQSAESDVDRAHGSRAPMLVTAPNIAACSTHTCCSA